MTSVTTLFKKGQEPWELGPLPVSRNWFHFDLFWTGLLVLRNLSSLIIFPLTCQPIQSQESRNANMLICKNSWWLVRHTFANRPIDVWQEPHIDLHNKFLRYWFFLQLLAFTHFFVYDRTLLSAKQRPIQISISFTGIY